MKSINFLAAFLATGLLTVAAFALAPRRAAQFLPADAPRYDKAGRLVLPAGYREWVFLSSGIDMRYTDEPAAPDSHVFDNVFAPRAAYDAFKATGRWPDKTILILENRTGATKGSINRSGQFQTGRLGLEAHVKDVARFKGGWGFFAFDDNGPAALIDYKADCYACHQANAAVDTTFVQFYPTLLPIAIAKGTASRKLLAPDADSTSVK